uniref:Uncharacterized protein n=1 Tax=Anguilla anguilla TaxID=7936 RepID=A0A0E9U6Z3_ANGAN
MREGKSVTEIILNPSAGFLKYCKCLLLISKGHETFQDNSERCASLVAFKY